MLVAMAGGLIQLLAGMWEMWKNNTFAATAFSSYGELQSCFRPTK
jgi:succinate-acetate transporter protein